MYLYVSLLKCENDETLHELSKLIVHMMS